MVKKVRREGGGNRGAENAGKRFVCSEEDSGRDLVTWRRKGLWEKEKEEEAGEEDEKHDVQ